MQKHVLNDRIRPLAVLNNLVEIASQSFHQFGNLAAFLIVQDSSS